MDNKIIGEMHQKFFVFKKIVYTIFLNWVQAFIVTKVNENKTTPSQS